MNKLKKIKQVIISDLKINCYLSIEDAAQDIIDNCIGNGGTAVAINSDKIVLSAENQELNSFLNKSSILYIDGVGVRKLAEIRLGDKLPTIPGCELWLEVVKKSNNLKIFLLGSTDSVVLRTKNRLEADYDANIVGSYHGYFSDKDATMRMIKDSNADIVFVALGSPKQELFISSCRDLGIKSFMMGLGGSFDLFVGDISRAPKVLRYIYLEWLYRLLIDPRRGFKRFFRLLNYIKLVLFKQL